MVEEFQLNQIITIVIEAGKENLGIEIETGMVTEIDIQVKIFLKYNIIIYLLGKSYRNDDLDKRKNSRERENYRRRSISRDNQKEIKELSSESRSKSKSNRKDKKHRKHSSSRSRSDSRDKKKRSKRNKSSRSRSKQKYNNNMKPNLSRNFPNNAMMGGENFFPMNMNIPNDIQRALTAQFNSK